MSEDPAASGKRGLGPLTWALWVAALIGVAALIYIMLQSSTKPAPVVATGPAARAPLRPLAEKLTRPAQPTPPPDYVFYNDAGKPVRIADFKGRVVFVNLWATWCAPCKVEMPTIAKAAAAYTGKPVEFVTLSIDKPDAAVQAKLFISGHEPLRFYSDPEAKIIFQFSPPAAGMPTTVIYGKDGLEKARVSGEADWSSPEARALIDEALSG